jgi:hypothetical protein
LNPEPCAIAYQQRCDQTRNLRSTGRGMLRNYEC